MCGVIGCVTLSGEILPSDIMKRLLILLHHRGPDAAGIATFGSACFGHTRLSILGIDSEESNQPVSIDGSMLSFNGEIYNYKELFSRLRNDGVSCSGTSDTEVLFNCLTHWGIDKTLSCIDGMYAFAYRDGKSGDLFFARDPLGEKPLYWSSSKERFWISSEIKVLLATGDVLSEPNVSRLDDYFCTGKVNGHETIFKNVYEVKPGTYLRLKADSKTHEVVQHWSLESFPNVETINYGKELVEIFQDKLEAAIVSRRVSDVPLGLLLSGGIDSNTILDFNLAKNPEDEIKLFFADNSYKEFSERSDVELTIKHMKKKYPGANLPFYSEVMSFDSYAKELDKLTWFYDEPVQFPITPQFVSLNKMAREQGIKVLLSGEGADELLFGYDRFTRTSKIIDKDGSRVNIMSNTYLGGGINNYDIVKKLTTGLSKGIESTAPWLWLDNNIEKFNYNSLQMLFSQKFRLQTLLQRQDRGGMAESIEVRVPFLAPWFVSWCNSLPMDARYNDVTGETKRILRKLMKHRLPNRILSKDKQGSTSDVQKWLSSKEMKILCQSLVNDEHSFSHNYLDGKFVCQMIEDHFSSKRRLDTLIWMILTLEIWFKKFKDGVQLPELGYRH